MKTLKSKNHHDTIVKYWQKDEQEQLHPAKILINLMSIIFFLENVQMNERTNELNERQVGGVYQY